MRFSKKKEKRKRTDNYRSSSCTYARVAGHVCLQIIRRVEGLPLTAVGSGKSFSDAGFPRQAASCKSIILDRSVLESERERAADASYHHSSPSLGTPSPTCPASECGEKETRLEDFWQPKGTMLLLCTMRASPTAPRDRTAQHCTTDTRTAGRLAAGPPRLTFTAILRMLAGSRAYCWLLGTCPRTGRRPD